jgi:hypothetical protein
MTMIDVSGARKKIAEAQWFLDRLTEQRARFFGDKEPFDYLLSAYLNAARKVEYRLHHEHNSLYKPWRKKWDAGCTADELALMSFMVDDRDVEVHEKGSTRTVGQEGVKFGDGTHHIEGGTVMIAGPPGMEPAVTYRPSYSYTISGSNREVTEACAEHLALLRRMVDRFESDHP